MTKEDLQQQLYEPLRFIDPHAYATRRRKIIWHASIAIALGLLLLIIGPILYANNQIRYSTGLIGNPGGMVLAAFLFPIYGIWRLLTIKSWIVREERVRLLWLNPSLKEAEEKRKVEQKNNDRKPMIILMILLSVPIIIGLVFYVLSLIKFAQS